MIKKYQKILLFIFISALFVFLRVYNIQNTLLFFNDLGRDLLVLLDWQISGKPPLLGPQTSSLPFNQSAIYFYLLYPLFVLTKHSLYSPLYTLLLFYLAIFLFSLHLTKNHKELTKITLLTWFLFSIHPQFIIQNRYVWNPSFVAPLVFLSLTSLFLFLKKQSSFLLFVFTFSLSLAVSFSYSVLPLLFVLFLYAFLKTKKLFLLSFSFLFSLLMTNLPTIFFELRHHFSLTQALLTKTSFHHTNNSFLEKITNLFHFSLSTSQIFLFLFLLIFVPIIVKIKLSSYPKKMFIIYLFAFLATVVFPFPVHSHYIFPTLTVFLFTLSSLFLSRPALLLLITSVIWLTPSLLKNYFQPAFRTPTQTIDCIQAFCEKERDPIFVAVQAGHHPYHHGPEFRFLLKDQGCQVYDIEKEGDRAQKMAIVVDNSSYTHQKTNFYELDLFGPSKEDYIFTCQENLRIYLLSKTNQSP